MSTSTTIIVAAVLLRNSQYSLRLNLHTWPFLFVSTSHFHCYQIAWKLLVYFLFGAKPSKNPSIVFMAVELAEAVSRYMPFASEIGIEMAVYCYP